jgi:hypothetical protein
MLINLNLTKKLGSGPTEIRYRTGTIEFMAIKVLEGKAHIYRYNLESFFYVFLWIIIRYGLQELPKISRLRR